MENNDLVRGIAAAQSGNSEEAQANLARVIQNDPSSEQGWLWLGHCLSDPQKRLYCYQRVLRLNPHNETARQAILDLNADPQPVQENAQEAQMPAIRPAPAPPPAAVAKRKSGYGKGLRAALLILDLALFLCVLPFSYLMMTGRLQSLTASLPPLPVSINSLMYGNPTATPEPSATAILNPSPIPHTATPTASPIPETSTPTVSPTDTPYVFKPGDPTATPLGSDISAPNFVAGVAAYNADDYKKALSLMNAAIKSNPDLAPPYRYRGMVYWSLKDCASGLADEEKAVSLDPDYALAWADRGLMYECLGDEAQELEDYQKALSLDPSLAFVHHNLGVYYFAQGDYQTSLEEYSQSAAIDPTRSDAWDGMSEALGQMGRYAECIQKATRAIEIDPELWLAYSDRAICYENSNLNALAIADYQKIIAHDPRDAHAWFGQGHAQRHSGDDQGAIASYSKALQLDASFYQAYINRGMIYIDLKKYSTALSDFNAALKIGDIPLAYSGRGEAYYGLKQYARAIADYDKFLSFIPDSARAYCDLALAYYEIGKYQDALDAADTSNRIDPTCGGQKLLEIQGRSYYALGNYDQALLYMDRTLAIKPYMLGYYYRGIIYQAAGKNEEAIRDLEQFLSDVKFFGYKGVEVADARARLKKLKP